MEEEKEIRNWKIKYVNKNTPTLIRADHLVRPNKSDPFYKFYLEGKLVAQINESKVLILLSDD